MPKLAAERRRAQHIGRGQRRVLGLVVDLAEHRDPAVVEDQRLDVLGLGADQREPRRDVLAQRLERPQQDR